MPGANGTQSAKLQFKPRKLAQENRPDAPEGEWDFILSKGRSKAALTPVDRGSDPYITIVFKIRKAYNPKQVTFQGSEVTQRLTYYDQTNPERRTAANANLRFAREFAEALGVELTDIYPDEITPSNIEDVIGVFEGKTVHGWTKHRSREVNGETLTNTDIRFKQPPDMASSVEIEEEEEEVEEGGETVAASAASAGEGEDEEVEEEEEEEDDAPVEEEEEEVLQTALASSGGAVAASGGAGAKKKKKKK